MNEAPRRPSPGWIRKLGRALSGEARDRDLCHALAESLHLPAKSGDPLAALVASGAPQGLPEPHAPHPGWAVACGLARAPLDL